MKVCFKCKKRLPLFDFYKHKQTKDGYLNKCKRCTRVDVSIHRAANLDKIRAYDRARGNRQGEGYAAEYRERYPNKYKAHNMVNNAVRDGKLFKEPCGSCGIGENIHAHHDDYLKPLNVRWLCSACHSQWHKDNGEGKNG
jgi:hypothetical protein